MDRKSLFCKRIQCTVSNQFPLSATQYSKNCFLQPQGAHSFCSLIVREHLYQPAWQSTPTRKGDTWKSYFSQGKQGHKLSIEEAITSWSDTATHFSQSNSRRGLQPCSYRLLTRLVALLTQASSAMPNWSGRFNVALSKPREPSDVSQ